MVKDAKKVVMQMTSQVGKHETKTLLMGEGLSSSLSDKLVGNRYKSELSELYCRAIFRAQDALKKRAS